jgi:hypothetical protein
MRVGIGWRADVGDILSLAKKLERAMRNGTGFNVTPEEVSALVQDDIVDVVYAAKLRRLKEQCPARIAPTSSENTGSTRGGTASRPAGRSQPTSPEADRSYIARLGFGT